MNLKILLGGLDHIIIFYNPHSIHEGKGMHVCMYNTYFNFYLDYLKFYIKADIKIVFYEGMRRNVSYST